MRLAIDATKAALELAACRVALTLHAPKPLALSATRVTLEFEPRG
jgi:hypothetical protein